MGLGTNVIRPVQEREAEPVPVLVYLSTERQRLPSNPGLAVFVCADGVPVESGIL